MNIKSNKLDFRNMNLCQFIIKIASNSNYQNIIQILNQMHQYLIYIEYRQMQEYFEIALFTILTLTKFWSDEFDLYSKCLLLILDMFNINVEIIIENYLNGH